MFKSHFITPEIHTKRLNNAIVVHTLLSGGYHASTLKSSKIQFVELEPIKTDKGDIFFF